VVAIASPRSADSFDKKLKRFADRVLRKAPSPLLPQPSVEETPTRPALLHRSWRIATQPLSRVLVSKWGEVLVMQRIGFIDGRTTPSTTAKEAYDSVFGDDPNPSHQEAIRELFADPVGEGPRRSRRRASQRD
jgi:hypothetical protein